MTNSITKELHRSVLIDALSRAFNSSGEQRLDISVSKVVAVRPPIVTFRLYTGHCPWRRNTPTTKVVPTVGVASTESCLNSPDDGRFHPDRDSTRRSVKVCNGYDCFSNSQTSHLRPKTMLRIARSVAYDIVQSRSSRKSMMLRHHAGCSANQSIDSKVSHHMYRNTQKQNKTDE